jgi:hypothetical protein
MSDDLAMWATFNGGSLHSETRYIGLAGKIDWPEVYELIPTGEVWHHVGNGRYVLARVKEPEVPSFMRGPFLAVRICAVGCLVGAALFLVGRRWWEAWMVTIFGMCGIGFPSAWQIAYQLGWQRGYRDAGGK